MMPSSNRSRAAAQTRLEHAVATRIHGCGDRPQAALAVDQARKQMMARAEADDARAIAERQVLKRVGAGCQVVRVHVP